MKNPLSEKEYKAQSKRFHYSKHGVSDLNRWIQQQKPVEKTDSFFEAQILVKLAIEKINQHNGIMERKLSALKRQGHIDSNGDKSYC